MAGLADMIGGGALGTLVVQLSAEATNLLRGMSNAEAVITKSTGKMSKQLAMFSTAAAGAFTVAATAFLGFTKASINAADQMGKTAQIAGQTVEAFSALAFAGDLAKVSQSELALASKFLVQWMEKTGKKSTDLTEEMIRQADEFAKVTDPVSKLQMAYERFGRSGGQLLPLLNQGSAALRRQMDEAKLFGNVIGKDFAKNSEQFNDNLTRIHALFKGVFNMVAERLLPVWITMQERFLDWVTETKAHIVVVENLIAAYDTTVTVIKAFALGILTVWTVLKSLATIIATAVTIQLNNFMIGVDHAVQLVGAWWEALKGIIQGLGQMASVAGKSGGVLTALLKRDFQGVAAGVKDIAETITSGFVGVTTSVTKGVSDSARIVQEGVGRVVDNTVGLSTSAIDDLTTMWSDWVTTGAKMMEPIKVSAKAASDTVKQTLQDIEGNSARAKELLDKIGMPTLGALDPFTGQALGQSKEVVEAQNKLKMLEDLAARELQLTKEVEQQKLAAIEAYNNKLRELQFAQAAIVVDAGANMFDQLGQAVKGFAGESSDAYKAMFAASKAFAIAESIIKIQQGVANALSLPWPANLVAAASVVASAANIISTIQAVQLNFGGKRALGGPVTPGQSFLVGERGPEMFTPTRSGSIVPNDALGGGGTKVVINNFTDARPEVTERQEGDQKVIEVTLRRFKGEIASEIRDGTGDITKAMQAGFGLKRQGR